MSQAGMGKTEPDAAPRVRQSGPLARRPVQKRGRERFDALLDCAETLLAAEPAGSFSIYDLAARAEVPPASVYHFFPTWRAVTLALATRYTLQLAAALDQPLDRAHTSRWTDFIGARFRIATAFFNDHPVFSRLLLGGMVAPDLRALDVEAANNTSRLTYAKMSEYFVLPPLPDEFEKFTTLVAIFDGVAMASYARHGHITPHFAAEAEHAGVAYCRTFLPEHLPLRPPTS